MDKLILVAAIAGLSIVRAASAHVVVEPRESVAGEVVTYTVRIPSHLAATTIAVEVEIPDGVEIVSVPDTPGGHATKKSGGRITGIRWVTRIPADEKGTVSFVARNPKVAADIAWKAHQIYDNGVTVDWVEPKGGKETASITKIAVSPAARQEE